MREILSDLETGPVHGSEDPISRAQRATKLVMPKRFYQEVSVASRDDGWTVELDGKPVRTPGKQIIFLPNQQIAELVASEFSSQTEFVDLATMPAYRLINSAVDGVADNPRSVADEIVKFAGTDLVFYRASSPERLVVLQNKLWTPVVDWARSELNAKFILAEGVMHVEQPEVSLAAVSAHVQRDHDPLRLAALHVMTTISGSALIALALEAGALSFEQGWNAAHVDEDWNIEQWGEDEEAGVGRVFRRQDMQSAYAILMMQQKT